MSAMIKPRIAMVLGDPAGIGPELIAKLLTNQDVRNKADIILIADKAEAERGMDIAGVRYPYRECQSLDNLVFEEGVPLFFNYRGDVEGDFPRAVMNPKGGQYCLKTLEKALRLTESGVTDAVMFAPLNKGAMHSAGMNYDDELHWFADLLGYKGPICEFNTMDGLWTSRVTSHVSLREVPDLITEQRVIDGISLIQQGLALSDVKNPRIAVCGLNPHNGDNGMHGREELDIITPTVVKAKALGINVEGPFPADTIFLKVTGDRKEYDGIVTMYHDQGQIAIKLLGFSRGVTVQGGIPIPMTTPAHGTAFDISQKGVANVGATLNAFEIAVKMGRNYRKKRAAQ